MDIRIWIYDSDFAGKPRGGSQRGLQQQQDQVQS